MTHVICGHAAQIAAVAEPLDVCEACVAIGASWETLRQCLVCGLTLCCDTSPQQHISRHWTSTRHPVMRSVDAPRAQWTWCFEHDATIRATPSGWQTYDAFLEAGRWYAERHLAAGATAHPHDTFVTPEGFPLGRWFAYVYERAAEGRLVGGDRDTIVAAGVPLPPVDAPGVAS